MKEALLALFAGALESFGESKLIEALQLLHDKDTAKYELTIRGAYAFVTGIAPLTDASKNKIDDAVVNSIKDAISQSAAANGVTL